MLNHLYFTAGLAICVAAGASCTQSDLKKIGKVVEASTQTLAPTQGESIKATKQAIEEGVKFGVNSLGSTDGFLKSSFRLAAPAELQNAMKFARKSGLGKYADQFELSLNRAAEQASAAATPVFMDAIKEMTVVDVVDILKGPKDAATQYFQRKSTNKLQQTFTPIVAKATAKTEVSKYYKQLAVPLAPLAKLAGVEIPTVSIEEYVTNEAISALFTKIASEEAKIRENPAERTTAILKKVFSYYDKDNKKS